MGRLDNAWMMSDRDFMTSPPMNEQRARDLLGSRIQAGNSLADDLEYLAWEPDGEQATLDGRFTADELEAIAWWMHNKHQPKSR
jgi:hypothetical protein